MCHLNCRGGAFTVTKSRVATLLLLFEVISVFSKDAAAKSHRADPVIVAPEVAAGVVTGRIVHCERSK